LCHICCSWSSNWNRTFISSLKFWKFIWSFFTLLEITKYIIQSICIGLFLWLWLIKIKKICLIIVWLFLNCYLLLFRNNRDDKCSLWIWRWCNHTFRLYFLLLKFNIFFIIVVTWIIFFANFFFIIIYVIIILTTKILKVFNIFLKFFWFIFV
jgi:hypothetical protein